MNWSGGLDYRTKSPRWLSYSPLFRAPLGILGNLLSNSGITWRSAPCVQIYISSPFLHYLEAVTSLIGRNSFTPQKFTRATQSHLKSLLDSDLVVRTIFRIASYLHATQIFKHFELTRNFPSFFFLKVYANRDFTRRTSWRFGNARRIHRTHDS